MPSSNQTPFTGKIKFIMFAFGLSAVLCIIQRQIFTRQSFAETVVFVSCAVYLLLKYFSSKTILRYQQGGYHPDKWMRTKDDLLVNTTVHIVLPVCMDLTYACFALLLLKYSPFVNLGAAARSVSAISDFNHEHIKFPLLIAGIVMAVLTLANWLSEKYYKKYKQITKKLTAPLKVIAILLFFINADAGIESRRIEFALHENPVEKADKVTFNASREQEEKLQQAAQAFIDNVTSEVDLPTGEPEVLIAPSDNAPGSGGSQEDPATSEQIALVMDHTQQVYEQNTAFKRDFTFSSNSTYTEEEKSAINSIFEERLRQADKATPDFTPNNLYNQAYSKQASFFDDLKSTLNNDKESIHVEAEESATKKILKDYLGEFLGKTWLFDALPESIHFPGLLNCGIFKDKVFDLVKDKITDGFFLLVSGKDASLQRVKSITSYVRSTIRKSLSECLVKIKTNTLLVKKYYADLQDKFINWKTAALDEANPTSDMTYEQGLKKKQAIRDARLHEEEKTFTPDYWRKKLQEKYPDMDAEELEKNVQYNIQRVSDKVAEMIQSDHEILDQKKYTDFNFIKNQYTSGGIFFGKSLDSNNAVSYDYYPALQPPGTFQYLSPTSLWIKKQQGQYLLFIKTPKGIFQFEDPVDASMFLTAYRFVFDQNTYPSLIDIFHDFPNDKTVVEVPAFHKCFVHNDPMKKLFLTADKFIFDVLGNKINSAKLNKLLSGSRAAYQAEADNFRKHPGYSRLYDAAHVLCSGKPGYFSLHTNIFFSVVQTKQADEELSDLTKYKEISSISDGFNQNKTALITDYPYLQQIHRFASYQALLRAVKKNDIDLLELFSK